MTDTNPMRSRDARDALRARITADWYGADVSSEEIVALLDLADEGEKASAPQPCGHPAACVVSSEEGTAYCGWCADVAAWTTKEVQAITHSHSLAYRQGAEDARRLCAEVVAEIRMYGQEEDGGQTVNLTRVLLDAVLDAIRALDVLRGEPKERQHERTQGVRL